MHWAWPSSLIFLHNEHFRWRLRMDAKTTTHFFRFATPNKPLVGDSEHCCRRSEWAAQEPCSTMMCAIFRKERTDNESMHYQLEWASNSLDDYADDDDIDVSWARPPPPALPGTCFLSFAVYNSTYRFSVSSIAHSHARLLHDSSSWIYLVVRKLDSVLSRDSCEIL